MVDNYSLGDYEFKDYDSPFKIYDSMDNFLEINDELIDIDFYSEKYIKIIEEGIANNDSYRDIRESIVESDL